MLQEKIKNIIVDYIGSNYGEDEDEACYDVNALASVIASGLEKTGVQAKKLIKLGKIEQGRCPYCSSTSLQYGAIKFQDDMAYYPVKCDGCQRDLEEWYRFDFAGYNVGEHLDIEAAEGMEIELPETDNNYEVGRRIRCIHMLQNIDPIPDGTLGTIISLDDNSKKILVLWDNKRAASVIPDVDEIELV